MWSACLACLVLLIADGQGCGFEDTCSLWTWNSSRVVTGQEVNNSWVPGDSARQGPFSDVDSDPHGHFLYKYLKTLGELHVWSSNTFGRPNPGCRLIFWHHMYNMSDGHFRVIIATNNTQSIVSERNGNDLNRWQNYSVNIGGIKQEFSIILEFVPGNKYPLHIALDNITLNNCFPDPPKNVCQPSQFHCSDGTCIENTQVCNINNDCRDGDDELRDECEEVPEFARCTFEDGWCGWHNGHGTQPMNWTLNYGATPTPSTGPTTDHTFRNSTGNYVFVEMTGASHSMGAAALLESPIIYPPPRYHGNITSLYYNSCHISFYYHKFGMHSGSLGVFLIELQENANRSSKIWWIYGDKGNKWLRNFIILPNITNRYYLQFEARKSFAARGDPAIDDISMSPKCFGIGVPKEHLEGYDYSNPFPSLEPTPEPTTNVDFVNATYYKFSTCGATGRFGPTQMDCDESYNNTPVRVKVLAQKQLAGIQQWTVPSTEYYTIIAKGASGGKGSDGAGVSWSAMTRTVLQLRKGMKIYLLVGQEGNPACLKTFSSNKKTVCQGRNSSKKALEVKLKEIFTLMYLPEGGGGGGGTFIFTWEKEKRPLLIAGGGGGLAHKSSHEPDIAIQHGKMMNGTLQPTTGQQYGVLSGGAGGGWRRANFSHTDATGFALMQGGAGGKACYESNDGSDMGAGGFGGGGGGCTAGGGGGGYTGGRAWSQKGDFGEGGYSWIADGMMQKMRVPGWSGPGEVYVIPATPGCGCEFRCVALDIHRSKVLCICPDGSHLANDSTSCILNNAHRSENSLFIIMAILIIIFFVGVTMFCIFLYSRYRKKKFAKARRQIVAGADLQLNRLRVASDSMMTEYNPNYEFGGGVYSLRDLKEIPREHLRLVKALGQGAFGEVYQGFFKHRAGDAVEMPVAVKTLPELSTSQAETDFLMEALIMSKFNHPNIVHFIGVCFDKHPRFIVIELLAGGDLKTFLRESRPKPDRASPLTMKDLLSCIIDVAKGCKYMEENRFIHRDIAARNCLLTSKGPGRVVKIADFGMARDIYRADYYRKGGKAMLPIKWMPPEAFLDGIFTTKTDVWSFGVLMWEVMSLGYMPYTGCANREVMQLVTSGGRLEPPTNCPLQLYAIMTHCWQPNPDDRPSFTLVLERLGYCMQDPDVIRAPLPVYNKPPSSERDTTIMRPTGNEECIQADYLVPMSGPLSNDWEAFGNHLPESRSTQPLLDSSPSGAGSPATNNNNPLSAMPEKPFHSNHIHPEQEIFIVSKADTEISC